MINMRVVFGSSLPLLVILLCQMSEVESSAKLQINVGKFLNPNHLKVDGSCCDGERKDNNCTGTCDYSLQVCLGTSLNARCDLITFDAGAVGVSDTGDVTFLSGLSNPLPFDITSWQGEIQISVTVTDEDTSYRETVDTFSFFYSLQSPARNRLLGQQDYTLLRQQGNRTVEPTSLSLEVGVMCDRFYFSDNCSVNCVPSDDCNGHYQCDVNTGQRQCLQGWSGDTCNSQLSDDHGCSSDQVCEHGSTCVPYGNQEFYCCCARGYTGPTCQTDIDECASTPCLNNGQCLEGLPGTYSCQCTDRYKGENCETSRTCSDSPCRNNGNCNVLTVGPNTETFYCSCQPGYTGDLCEVQIITTTTTTTPLPTTAATTEASTAPANRECDSNPCLNEGVCEEEGPGDYRCMCTSRYKGFNCQLFRSCSDGPCLNEGQCLNQTIFTNVLTFFCSCPPGFTGDICDIPVDTSTPASSTASPTFTSPVSTPLPCPDNFYGANCSVFCVKTNNCEGHYDCDQVTGRRVCSFGWSGEFCDVAEITDPSCPCLNGGQCLNGSCCCAASFTGNFCEIRLSSCTESSCLNGGTCLQTAFGSRCECVEGFTGDDCETILQVCSPFYYGPACDVFCRATDSCNEGQYSCDFNTGARVCRFGWKGTRCDQRDPSARHDVMCPDSQCRNGGQCFNSTCCCPPGFTGSLCHIEILECASNPCRNGGRCQDLIADYSCECQPRFTGKNCETTQSVPTGSTTPPITDPCLNLACSNNATCVAENLTTAICLCQQGFTGELCQDSVSQLSSTTNPNQPACPENYYGTQCGVYCRESDSCGGGHYYCQALTGSKMCYNGWSGPDCRTRLVAPDTDPGCPLGLPCRNGGTCFQGSCCCRENFSGTFCEVERLPCDSLPCKNGVCNDLINGYNCSCSPGYAGSNCDVFVGVTSEPGNSTDTSAVSSASTTKVAGIDCGPFVCYNGAQCMFFGFGYYRCVCGQDYTGDECETLLTSSTPSITNNTTATVTVNSTASSTNNTTDSLLTTSGPVAGVVCGSIVCLNGATCLDDNIGLCFCAPNFTGTQCETFLTSEPSTITSDVPYTEAGTTGITSEVPSSTSDSLGLICGSSVCYNGGQCLSFGFGVYRCLCGQDYTGEQCETLLTAFTLSSTPVSSTVPAIINQTTVTALINNTTDTFNTTAGLSTPLGEVLCGSIICLNEASCLDDIRGTCVCASDFTGPQCETLLTTESTTFYEGSFQTTVTSEATSTLVEASTESVSPEVSPSTTESTGLLCGPYICYNGARCEFYGFGSYGCQCTSEYEGDECQSPVSSQSTATVNLTMTTGEGTTASSNQSGATSSGTSVSVSAGLDQSTVNTPSSTDQSTVNMSSTDYSGSGTTIVIDTTMPTGGDTTMQGNNSTASGVITGESTTQRAAGNDSSPFTSNNIETTQSSVVDNSTGNGAGVTGTSTDGSNTTPPATSATSDNTTDVSSYTSTMVVPVQSGNATTAAPQYSTSKQSMTGSSSATDNNFITDNTSGSSTTKSTVITTDMSLASSSMTDVSSFSFQPTSQSARSSESVSGSSTTEPVSSSSSPSSTVVVQTTNKPNSGGASVSSRVIYITGSVVSETSLVQLLERELNATLTGSCCSRTKMVNHTTFIDPEGTFVQKYGIVFVSTNGYVPAWTTVSSESFLQNVDNELLRTEPFKTAGNRVYRGPLGDLRNVDDAYVLDVIGDVTDTYRDAIKATIVKAWSAANPDCQCLYEVDLMVKQSYVGDYGTRMSHLLYFISKDGQPQSASTFPPPSLQTMTSQFTDPDLPYSTYEGVTSVPFVLHYSLLLSNTVNMTSDQGRQIVAGLENVWRTQLSQTRPCQFGSCEVKVTYVKPQLYYNAQGSVLSGLDYFVSLNGQILDPSLYTPPSTSQFQKADFPVCACSATPVHSVDVSGSLAWAEAKALGDELIAKGTSSTMESVLLRRTTYIDVDGALVTRVFFIPSDSTAKFSPLTQEATNDVASDKGLSLETRPITQQFTLALDGVINQTDAEVIQNLIRRSWQLANKDQGIADSAIIVMITGIDSDFYSNPGSGEVSVISYTVTVAKADSSLTVAEPPSSPTLLSTFQGSGFTPCACVPLRRRRVDVLGPVTSINVTLLQEAIGSAWRARNPDVGGNVTVIVREIIANQTGRNGENLSYVVYTVQPRPETSPQGFTDLDLRKPDNNTLETAFKDNNLDIEIYHYEPEDKPFPWWIPLGIILGLLLLALIIIILICFIRDRRHRASKRLENDPKRYQDMEYDKEHFTTEPVFFENDAFDGNTDCYVVNPEGNGVSST